MATEGLKVPAWTGTSLAQQTLILTQRSLWALWSKPLVVALGLAGPLIILVLFSQVFASIAETPGFPKGVGYIDFLMPAILVSGALGAAVQSGTALLNDMRNGVVARFRSLPVSPLSVVLARSLADGLRTGVQLATILVMGRLLFGLAPAGGLTGLVAAWGLALLIGWLLSWPFMAMGAWISNPEVLSMVTFVLMFPLMFASSAYLPVGNLPPWLRFVAKLNPLSYAIDACRGLVLGTPVHTQIMLALVFSALLGLIGALIAVAGFRRTR